MLIQRVVTSHWHHREWWSFVLHHVCLFYRWIIKGGPEVSGAPCLKWLLLGLGPDPDPDLSLLILTVHMWVQIQINNRWGLVNTETWNQHRDPELPQRLRPTTQRPRTSTEFVVFFVCCLHSFRPVSCRTDQGPDQKLKDIEHVEMIHLWPTSCCL